MSPFPGTLPALLPLIDHALAADAVPRIILVRRDTQTGRPDVVTEPIPDDQVHPVDILFGRRVDEEVEVIGLEVRGTVHQLPRPGDRPGAAPAGPVSADIVILADRRGAIVTRICRGDGAPTDLLEAPTGWVAYALLRGLGAATPPPDIPVAACIEALWLDAIAELALTRPASPPTWAAVARCHPLATGSDALPGVLLAAETQALDQADGWQALRTLHGWSSPIPGPWAPSWASNVPLDLWFDDGSFARWMHSALPPAHDLLPAVLDVLPERVGHELLDGLATLAWSAGAA